MSEVRTDAFALPLPEGWADRTVVTLAGPADDGYAPNVVVTREVLCDHMGLGAFSQGWQTLLVRPGAGNPPRPGRARPRSRGAGRRSASSRGAAAGVHLTQIAFLFVEGELGYAIVGTCTHDRFEEFEPVFRQVAAGFKLAEEAIR